MKIAIVTIYSAMNYGGFLQAYAMQKTLEQFGHSVVMLNCSQKSRIMQFRDCISLRDIFFSFKLYKKYSIDWKLLNIKKNNNEHYDVVIIGSDEVWNINGGFEHWNEYLGVNLNTNKIIAYAPSIGYSKPEDLLINQDFVSKIKSFDIVFPRDCATSNMATQAGCNVGSLVIDPTILYINHWKQHITSRKIKEKYILYYSYLDDTPMKKYITKYAEEFGYKIIVAGFNYKWCDNVAIVSPLEFISLIYYAECVFTSTFHGTVFSTILNKQLVVRPSGQKVIDYLKRIRLENQIYKDEMKYSDFKFLIENKIDYKTVNSILERESEVSKRLLISAINNEKGDVNIEFGTECS